MEEQKYYWVCFKYESSFGIKGVMDEVFMIHPLSKDFKEYFIHTLLKLETIMNWKEISEEEYKLSVESTRKVKWQYTPINY